MIQKVLIAEDHQSVNISLQKTLDELKINNVDTAYYCDDALQKIEIAYHAEQPYDLLITDLHFEDDHRAQQIKSGIGLISMIKKTHPDLKTLVFSAESKPGIINMLLTVHKIDGYVRKARHDADELKNAIVQIEKNNRYIPQYLVQLLRQQHSYHFTQYDITIISLLASGMPQKNIPSYLKQYNIQPSGLSSIEKRLNLIRETLQLYKNEQLVAFCKDMGII